MLREISCAEELGPICMDSGVPQISVILLSNNVILSNVDTMIVFVSFIGF